MPRWKIVWSDRWSAEIDAKTIQHALELANEMRRGIAIISISRKFRPYEPQTFDEVDE